MDTANEMKQSLSDIIEISLDTVVESAKTSDSHETISNEKAESDFFKNSGNSETLQHTPELQQNAKSVKSEFQKGKEKWKPIKVSSDSKEFSSPAIMKSHSKFKMKRMNEMPTKIYNP